jgi:hypothetical protein
MEIIRYIIKQKKVLKMIRGKKIASRSPWVYAAAAGLITFLILAILSTGASGTNSSTKQRKPTSVKNSIPGQEDLSPEPGYRGYAIKTGAADGTLDLASESSRIDVIVSFSAGPDGQPLTKTVIGGARLLRFDAGSRLAVVEVTPAEAEKIAFSEANGQIRLSVCPSGPDVSIAGKGATFEDI